MTQGSAYSPVKTALVARLQTRAGLTNANVSYQAPVRAEDVAGEFGDWESVYFDDAEGDDDIVILCGAANMVFDEDYVQTCIVQVLRPESEGTQQAADERVGELLYEVLAEIADQGEWDTTALGLNAFAMLEITPVSKRWRTGFLPSGAGHGSRCELGLRVRARLAFID